MFGYSQLKPVRPSNGETVLCPVLACTRKVAIQECQFRTSDEVLCPEHALFISPSTFEYQDYKDNLLWADEADLALLAEIRTSKRESRMARERSEDALTWNVFRFLERRGQLPKYLSSSLGISTASATVVYWSHLADERSTWSLLNEARTVFGESIQRGSEPDLIILCDHDIVFVEAKFISSNKTIPSEPENTKKYLSGAESWYQNVFQSGSSFKVIAIQNKLYELMRLWLLGTWIAGRNERRFHLVNLVREPKELDIEPRFKRHIREGRNGTFCRQTWEDIYRFVDDAGGGSGAERTQLLDYFKEKTIGYGSSGRLLRAFVV